MLYKSKKNLKEKKEEKELLLMCKKINSFKEIVSEIDYSEGESTRLIKKARNTNNPKDIGEAAWYNIHRLTKHIEEHFETYVKEFGCEFEDMFLIGFEALYTVVESDTAAIQKINLLSNKDRFTRTAVCYENIFNVEIGFNDLLACSYREDMKERREKAIIEINVDMENMTDEKSGFANNLIFIRRPAEAVK